MNLKNRLLKSFARPDKHQVEQLQSCFTPGYTVEIHPPKNHEKITIPRFIRTIQELQTKWLGIKNTSPTTSFEIRRTNQELKIQFTAPTKRLERKIRVQLTNHIPQIKFSEGNSGLPITKETTVGGGFLTTGQLDHYPLQTRFENPPTNPVTKTLHRHSMQGTQVIIQILFQPAAGNPVKNKYWSHRAYQKVNYLRKRKEKLWGSKPPTPREKQQADAIENKAGNNRFHTSIRFAVLGAGEYTKSRVKELSGAFNNYENPDTGQYFNTSTIQSLRENRIIRFADSISNRRLDNWCTTFQTTPRELAALTAIPNTRQQNIRSATP